MDYKYNVNNIVVIYKNPLFVDGGVGLILERDALELEYLVHNALEPAREPMWLKEEFLGELSFDKPAKKTLLQRMLNG